MKRKNWILFLLLIATIFLETHNISIAPIQEWDEARRGIFPYKEPTQTIDCIENYCLTK